MAMKKVKHKKREPGTAQKRKKAKIHKLNQYVLKLEEDIRELRAAIKEGRKLYRENKPEEMLKVWQEALE